MANSIAVKLKQLRLRKKLTQDDVARLVGITRSTVSNYERGTRKPNINDLQQLAKIYGIGLDYFNIAEKDEIVEIISRTKNIFFDSKIDTKAKEDLYHEFMKMYLEIKGQAS